MEHFGLSHILFDPANYVPDTLDLVADEAAREYWLNTCEKLVEKYVNYALTNTDDPTVEIRALKFKTCYVEALKELRTNPVAHGHLNVRLLMDINETCLRSQGFFDLWKKQKMYENDLSLRRLRARLVELDSIHNEKERWIELCRGVVAGNMFDRGAQAITALLDKDPTFGIHEALEKIQKRPWLIDGVDRWIERLEQKVHHCAAVFVDNSGVDIVLGMLPFVRALLLRGTSIILCANEWPALNDVTSSELEGILQTASSICPVIATALATGNLVVRSNGQRGPCLDLKTIGADLSTEFRARGVDLIVIEGMGRALHTNFYACLAVDSLKLAVIKNAWWAQRLGGPLFSVMFVFEEKPSTL